MQLRIAAAARPMHERSGHEPVATNGLGAGGAASCERRGALEVGERLPDSARMGVVNRRLRRSVADPEQDAHALGRRERDVEACDRAARAQDLAGDRAVARENGVQRVLLHAPVEPERPAPRPSQRPAASGPPR